MLRILDIAFLVHILKKMTHSAFKIFKLTNKITIVRKYLSLHFTS